MPEGILTMARTEPMAGCYGKLPSRGDFVSRRLPRSFEVRDGAVVRTFQGLPPLSPAGELRAAIHPD